MRPPITVGIKMTRDATTKMTFRILSECSTSVKGSVTSSETISPFVQIIGMCPTAYK